jgi:S1-C subfamily serine protease
MATKHYSSCKFILSLFLFTGILLLAAVLFYSGVHPQKVLAQARSSNDNLLTLPEIYLKAQKSVVFIQLYNSVQGPLGSGSGFVYDNFGHIVTNQHVTSAEGENLLGNLSIDVSLPDGTVYPARIIGADPYSDIAVLQVENVPKAKLIPLSIGNSSQILPGEQVAAFGNPEDLIGTMTAGIVSAIGRGATSQPVNGLSFDIPDEIQTDAAINPGNSGGPLLNMKGEVIGINEITFLGAQNIGFAISSNTVKRIVPQLITNGTANHPWLGILGQDMTSGIANVMHLQEPRGFLVTNVINGSPAALAGIKEGNQRTNIPQERISIMLGGDLILKVDNKEIRNLDDILLYLESTKSVGQQVHLTVLRDGKQQQIDVTLEGRPTAGIFSKGA